MKDMWSDSEIPIGLLLSRAARTAERAFDRSLGGGASRWQILRTLMARSAETQAALADAVGLRGATLVYHLDALEAEGLVVRKRAAGNRRLQTVALTDAGRAMFQTMLTAVVAYDARLRAVIGSEAEADLRAALQRIDAAFGDHSAS